jgi:dihydroorotate dehydrogenase subfamily 1
VEDLIYFLLEIRRKTMSKRLEVDFAGLKLVHPVVAASAGTTKDAEHSFRAQEAGFSAVVLKSVQEETVNRYNPLPRFAVVESGIPGYSATSFFCYEQAFEGDIDDYAETVRQTRQRVTVPVIASINCVKHESWTKYAEMVEQAGADAVEMVPSCPVGTYVREGANFYTVASDVLKAVKGKIKIPAGIKMSRQQSNPIACAVALEREGSNWVTMFNRNPGLQIDIEKMSPIMHRAACGHGGPWAVAANTRWIASAFPHLNIPISATGGVTKWEDVIRYMLAGAANVQVASLLYFKGYDVVKPMLDSIEEYLDRKGIESMSELIGRAVSRVQSLEAVDKSFRYYAQVTEDCISCGKCRDICLYDAIDFSGDRPSIDLDRCDGCGLCEQICDGAIVMKKEVKT